MAGGSVAQAKRRSSTGGNNNSVLEIGTASFQLVEKEPTREEILMELVKKRCLNINNPEKLKTIIIPIINERKAIMQSVTACGNDALAQAMDAAIPKETPKTISGSNLASTANASNSHNNETIS